MAGELLDKDDLQAPIVLNRNFEPLLDTLNQIVKAAKEHSNAIAGAKTTTKLKDETSKLTVEQKELVKVQNQIATLTAKSNKEYQEAAKRLETLKKELKQKTDLEQKDARLVDKTNSSMNELNKALTKNRQAYAALRTEQARSSKEGKELLQVIQKQDKEFKELAKSIGQVDLNPSGGLDKFKGVVSDLGGKFVPQATEGLSAMGGLLSSSTLLVGGLATGAIAMGKAFVDESIRARKQLTVVRKLIGETGLELEAFTARASATATVFDKEFNEVAKAGNVLVKEFGIESKEAFGGINQLMLRGVDINGDFLEQVSEYSTFIAQAGGETQDLVDILLASEKAGVFSDKGLDTVKEATIRIREMTPATKAAIEGIGLSAEAMQKALASGETSPLEAIKQITQRMKELPPISTQVGTAIADIFGGAGEDAGQFLFQLGEINETQGDWIDNLTGSAKAQYQLLQATEEYEATLLSVSGNFNSFSTNFQTFWTKVKTETLKILSDLSTAFTTFGERIDEYKKTLAETGSITALQKEIANLEDQIESGSTTSQKVMDFLLTGRVNGNRAIQRTNELHAKLNAAKERLNILLTEEKDKGDEVVETTKRQVKNYRELTVAAEKRVAAALALRRAQGDRTFDTAIDPVKDTAVEIMTDSLDRNDKAAAEASKRIEQELFDFKKKLDEQEIENKKKKAEDLIAIEMERDMQRREIFANFAAATSTIVNSITDNRLASIDAELEELEAQKQRELELAGDNEFKKIQIEEKFAKRSMELEEQKAKAQRKAAVFNKSIAIAQAAIDGATAVIKALATVPPLNFVLAATTGALVAAQIAAIAASPIPAYAEGTDFHQGGKAQVGEEGSELVVTPTGQLQLTPNKTSIVDLPRGSQVIPHDETLKMLALAGLSGDTYSRKADSGMVEELKRTFKSLEHTIKNKKETHYNWTRKGLERAFQYSGTRNYFMDNFYK